MLVADFNFTLPVELIARFPAVERDASRLMLLNRQKKNLSEDIFKNIASYLAPGDLLVMNDLKNLVVR